MPLKEALIIFSKQLESRNERLWMTGGSPFRCRTPNRIHTIWGVPGSDCWLGFKATSDAQPISAIESPFCPGARPCCLVCSYRRTVQLNTGAVRVLWFSSLLQLLVQLASESTPRHSHCAPQTVAQPLQLGLISPIMVCLWYFGPRVPLGWSPWQACWVCWYKVCAGC